MVDIDVKVIELKLEKYARYPVYRKLQDTINSCKAAAEKLLQHKYTGKVTLICTGSSGMTIATLIGQHITEVAPDYKFDIMYIQKEGDMAHHSHKGFIFKMKRNIVFVDDFIDSGATLNRIYSAVSEERIDSIGVILLQSTWTFDLHKLKFSPNFLICNSFN